MTDTTEKQIVIISPKTLLVTALILFLGWALIQIRETVLLFFIAVIVSAALSPPIRWIRRTQKLPQKLIILVFYLVFVVLFIGTLILIGNLMLEQGQQLMDNLPEYTNTALRRLSSITFLNTETSLFGMIANYVDSITSRILNFILSSLNYILTILQGVISMITIFVVAFYFLADSEHFKNLFLKLFPSQIKESVYEISSTILAKIGMYVRGQLIVMTITGILTWIGLSIVGAPYAFILGLIVFVLEIIPVIGPITAGAIGVLITLGSDPILALWAAFVYFIVQQIENYFLFPVVLGRSVGLHPLWILLSLLIGALLFGIPGVILAVPTAITIHTLTEEVYLKRYLPRIEASMSGS